MDFVIVGAQKCATTYLRDALSQHPGIYMPRGEDAFLEIEGPDALARAASHERQLREKASSLKLGVKRPNYLVNNHVRDLLHQLSPQCQLLVVVREPVSRAVSAYYHYAARGLAPDVEPSFFFSALLSGSVDPYYPRAKEILEWGRYAHYIERWFAVWDPQSMRIVEQRDLMTDAESELARVVEFLGLPPGGQVPTRSSNRGSYGPIRRSWLAMGRAVAQGDSLSGSRAALSRAMRSADSRIFSRYGSSEKPQLDPSVIEELESYYSEDQRRLSRLLAVQNGQ